MCTHVETPVSVWLQIVSDDNTKKIFNITEQLSALCPAAPKLSGQPDMNKVSQDNKLHHDLYCDTLFTLNIWIPKPINILVHASSIAHSVAYLTADPEVASSNPSLAT